jgi:hypothetical protein
MCPSCERWVRRPPKLDAPKRDPFDDRGDRDEGFRATGDREQNFGRWLLKWISRVCRYVSEDVVLVPRASLSKLKMVEALARVERHRAVNPRESSQVSIMVKLLFDVGQMAGAKRWTASFSGISLPATRSDEACRGG